MKYLLDTHTWIWWHTAPEKIPEKVKEIIAAPAEAETILLSAISVWEFCKLLERRKLILSVTPDIWLESALDMAGLFLVPLSPDILVESTRLPQPFHTDPSDQILTATARVFGALFLTKDERIAGYSSVRTLWE